jgi:hypothetical protein
MNNKNQIKEIKKYFREEIETRLDIMVEDLWDDYHIHSDFEERFGVDWDDLMGSEYTNDILGSLYDVVVIEDE